MHTSPHKPNVSTHNGSTGIIGYVDALFSADRPKFLFDDIYHFSMRHYERHRNNRTMLPVVKLMTATVLNHMKALDAPIFFIPEAITNGKSYHDLAERYEGRIRQVRDGRLTTYRMGEILNKDELEAQTEKNKNRAMSRLTGFQQLYPGFSVVSPTGMEAMLKTLVKDAGFTNYQMLRDEDFEGFWIAVCLNAQRGGFSGDVAYSRNGNFETFALFLTQYGVVPSRPLGDVDVVMPGKRSVTPYDYTEMLFSHLLDVVPRGFTSDLSVKMAVRMLMLEEMRTTGMPHPVWGPLDHARMSPTLQALGPTHDRAFARLRRDLLLFMKEHDLGSSLEDIYGLDGYDHLRDYYRELELPSPSTVRPGGGAWKSYQSESDAKLDLDAKLKKKELFNKLVRSIPYQLDGDFFSAETMLLPDHRYADLGRAEQVSLKASMGLIETIKPPVNAAPSLFLLTDRRGGELADAYARNFDVAVPGEARGLATKFSDANFEEQVKDANIQRALKLATALRDKHPGSLLNSFEEVETGADIFRHYREAIAAPGPDRWAGNAKLVYAAEIMRRQTDLAVFDKGWEQSAVLTALRLHARKIQLGLIERPLHMPHTHLLVADAADDGAAQETKNPYVIASLADDLRLLGGYMRKLGGAGTETYPRQAVRGLLETIVMLELYYNRSLNEAASGTGKHALVDWQSVPLSAKEGLESDKEAVLQDLEEARDVILSRGISALSPDELTGQLERIDPSYLHAWREAEAAQRKGMSRSARQASSQKLGGFNAK